MERKIKEEISYNDAMAEIEQILASLQQESVDVDTLTERVRRASTLIALCRERLRKTVATLDEIFK